MPAHVTHDFVRWSDIDLAGIMRYTAFPRFLELGEAELFRSLGVRYSELFTHYGVSLPRKVMHLEYHAPARLDDRLAIATTVSRVGTTSLTLSTEIRHAESGAPCASGFMVLVCTGASDFSKRPLPADLLELLAPYTDPTASEDARPRGGTAPGAS